MSRMTHTPLTNIELCYDGVHTPLTRTPIADIPKNEKGHWEYVVKDSFGNEMSYENYGGTWQKYTRDSFGNVLTYEDSNNNWYKFTRNINCNLLTREDKHGLKIYLTSDKLYGLYYEDGLYKAGCREFTYEQAIAHWTKRTKDINQVVKIRAIRFLAAIEKHQQGLKNATNDSHPVDQH